MSPHLTKPTATPVEAVLDTARSEVSDLDMDEINELSNSLSKYRLSESGGQYVRFS